MGVLGHGGGVVGGVVLVDDLGLDDETVPHFERGTLEPLYRLTGYDDGLRSTGPHELDTEVVVG